NEEVNKMSHAFIQLGLTRGDKIATVLPQSPAFMNVFMAAGNIGLVVVPLDPKLTTTEMENLCNRTNPKLLISIASDAQVIQTVEKLLEKIDITFLYAYQGELSGAKPY